VLRVSPTAHTELDPCEFSGAVPNVLNAEIDWLDPCPPSWERSGLHARANGRGNIMNRDDAWRDLRHERIRRDRRPSTRLFRETHLAESPLTCVAVGAGRSLEEFDAMRNSARAGPVQAPAAACTTGMP
jgi:hypothetical protein